MASIKIVLRNKPTKQEEYPIVMRVVKDRQSKLITLGMHTLKKDWDEVNNKFKRSYPNSNTRNRILLNFEKKALEIIDEFAINEVDFSLDDFESKFRGDKKNNSKNIVDFFEEIILEMRRAGRIGSANAYKDTKGALVKFSRNKIGFKDITPEFLEKFEVSMRERGNRDGGIAFRMRTLKALFNMAINRGLISRELYPFELYKVSKLKIESNKRALTIDEFKKFRDLDLAKHPHLIEAHNYFMFSIYTRGINFIDMMKLKWSNIQNGRISYTRSKTKGHFNLEIMDSAQVILDFYKNQNRLTDYVFPILLKEDLNPQQIENRKHKVLSKYNSKLKELGKLAEIEQEITSYVARHSFATILKMSGTPIEKISEMMGHKDVSITRTYLKEFSNEDLDVENRKFMNL